MKRIFGLFIALFVFATISMAQPGDPGCDPDATTSSWSLSYSPAGPVADGTTITVYATMDTPSTYGPVSGSITVSAGTGSCISSSPSSITAEIPCGQTSFAVGQFTLTNNCSVTAGKQFDITNITGGHTAGGFIRVSVNP